MIRDDYKLVWSEEFDGSEIDRNTWRFEEGYVRNNELQCYCDSPENAYLEDSCLVIKSIKTDDEKCPYTSASLNTHGKKAWSVPISAATPPKVAYFAAAARRLSSRICFIANITSKLQTDYNYIIPCFCVFVNRIDRYNKWQKRLISDIFLLTFIYIYVSIQASFIFLRSC